MMKRFLLAAGVCTLAMTSQAQHTDVKEFSYVGPLAIESPFMVDSLNNQGAPFNRMGYWLNAAPQAGAMQGGEVIAAGAIPVADKAGLKRVGFCIETSRFRRTAISVKGLRERQLFVDGRMTNERRVQLEPGLHEVVIQYLSAAGDADTLNVRIQAEDDDLRITPKRPEEGRPYLLQDVLNGTTVAGVNLSHSGRYLLTRYVRTLDGGQQEGYVRLTEVATGRVLPLLNQNVQWLPGVDQYAYRKRGENGLQMIAVDPVTGKETLLADGLPEKGFLRIAPSLDYALCFHSEQGFKEDEVMKEIVTPDDRIPGSRARSFVTKFDFKTGLQQPILFGQRYFSVSDISADGRELLVMSSEERLTQRPFKLYSLFRLSLETMKADTLFQGECYISTAYFCPDKNQILVKGAPESFGGIGMNVKPGQIPNSYNGELFLYDLAKREVQPLTKGFAPSVSNVLTHPGSETVYFTATNREREDIYRLNLKNGAITPVKTEVEVVESASWAAGGNTLVYKGESTSTPDRIYVLDTKKNRSRQLETPYSDKLEGIALGEVKTWNFLNSRGDSIYGRIYLPPHFDAQKTYPLIVNYYGGTTPILRDMESRYPHHAYASMGYVVYVLQPSGSIGFGQEFSARHVNAWGDFTADDIIEGTKSVYRAHSFIDSTKIGCIGASYGGFMTQYLQTRTDIFAAAISHAGISNITSYWGEGYWGYSYSEAASAGSYPWNNPKLYTEHSPLFHADKIHTPLLFLHGTDDTNVPIGESIQMFNALKLLGRETAFITVAGQDHQITDYKKRIKWQNTIFAWFAKWLQGDAQWWNALYPNKHVK